MMDEQLTRENRRGRLQVFAGLMAVSLAVAVIITHRLSDEALAVLAGAVCGVGAAIPTSLLIVAISRRRDAARGHQLPANQPARGGWHRPQTVGQWPVHPPQQGAYPPVVVVAPSSAPQRPDVWGGLPPSLAPPTQREFTVVGGTPADGDMPIYRG